MIQPTSLGEVSAANSKALLTRAQTTAVNDALEAAGAPPADSVDLKGRTSRSSKSSKSTKSSKGKGADKARSSHHKSKASKAEGPKSPTSAKYEKAAEKFLNSLVELQGCSEGDQKFIESAIVGTHQLSGLDGVQKQLILAQGLGKYAIGELGKLADEKNPAALSGQEKRWDTLSSVVRNANEMVKAFPQSGHSLPSDADYLAGAPGSGLLGNATPAPSPAPTNPAPGPTQPGAPTPPADPSNQAAMDDYNGAMKIYNEMWAARQKNMADLLKIQQDTQTAIMSSVSNMWAAWAKAFADGIALYNRYLGYGGDPRTW